MKRKSVRESNYFYAIRISNPRRPSFLARQHASAPALFWFHEDAVAHLKKCKKGKTCDCGKCVPNKFDIIKVFVSWLLVGKTFNEPGDMFRSKRELKRKNAK